jgi:23S rRNA-/tRNA-specific pseudouridylate synthase
MLLRAMVTVLLRPAKHPVLLLLLLLLQGQLPPRLFTVGRLDVATSGLIFLTNDGAQPADACCNPVCCSRMVWVVHPSV